MTKATRIFSPSPISRTLLRSRLPDSFLLGNLLTHKSVAALNLQAQFSRKFSAFSQTLRIFYEASEFVRVPDRKKETGALPGEIAQHEGRLYLIKHGRLDGTLASTTEDIRREFLAASYMARIINLSGLEDEVIIPNSHVVRTENKREVFASELCALKEYPNDENYKDCAARNIKILKEPRKFSLMSSLLLPLSLIGPPDHPGPFLKNIAFEQGPKNRLVIFDFDSNLGTLVFEGTFATGERNYKEDDLYDEFDSARGLECTGKLDPKVYKEMANYKTNPANCDLFDSHLLIYPYITFRNILTSPLLPLDQVEPLVEKAFTKREDMDFAKEKEEILKAMMARTKDALALKKAAEIFIQDLSLDQTFPPAKIFIAKIKELGGLDAVSKMSSPSCQKIINELLENAGLKTIDMDVALVPSPIISRPENSRGGRS